MAAVVSGNVPRSDSDQVRLFAVGAGHRRRPLRAPRLRYSVSQLAPVEIPGWPAPTCSVARRGPMPKRTPRRVTRTPSPGRPGH